ncbi:hypothetical protein [Paractinoplanes toevensis]|uniref:Uncharacterized protein n=1 Tax=Paractinoplanes toevensis TaxID=571911 RepID=A0A920BQ90_9ACTN|nr:hypothetical protein [Actinoplanes toevensis]GIM97094.1 hypothetical protein Ato02nite_088870 [Actinoplanes toevensis]
MPSGAQAEDHGGADRRAGAGLVGGHISVNDVLLAHRTIYGVIVTAADPAEVTPAVDRALYLLRQRRG